jgi:sulfur-oxidizing protein SoxX
MNSKHWILLAAAGAAALTGCAVLEPRPDYDALVAGMMKTSFREQGIAKLDRLQQDLAQAACSSDKAPPDAVVKQIEAQALASVKAPSDGRYLGDWKRGEALAQNGRGATWSDTPDSPNGGNCYNCHQIGKAELSYGTIGPSLYHYGKLRGVANPAAPEAQAIVQYTWAKLWNAKAFSACSGMPRFGHFGLLNEAQLRDLMALLLDPASPVNSQ